MRESPERNANPSKLPPLHSDVSLRADAGRQGEEYRRCDQEAYRRPLCCITHSI